MRVLDLFSGIGGFSLGLERAGMRTVAFCERDEYCRAVLRKHWPGIPCFDDIHTLDADGLDRLGRIDLVCGGFPCQPFSDAGAKRGKEDDRYLWPEMCRVVALARPSWVIGENVTGIIPMALDDVLADLEALGYTARTFVIPAAAIGAPHRRQRIWIIATNSDGGRQPKHSQRDCRPQAWLERTLRDHAGRCSPLDVADTDGKGLAIRKGERGNARQELTSAFRASWWRSEPDVGRVAHGIPRRVDRLRCLGNAVVPQIVEEIGRAIMLEHSY